MNSFDFIILYVAAVNVISFIVMGVDKRRAVKRAFRVPESTLFVLAIIGGSIGSIAGMHLFHHKTRHWYFLYGMPVILALQIILILAVVFSPIELNFW
ncbi:MAG: DUF1294 domain-containing protein [Lachnospiraceae bacterium]|nr:DUF1294 domain-containing protein [Lachnospiraceae bacterium]